MLRILTRILIFIVLAYVSILAIFSSSEFPTKTYHGNFMPYLVAKPITEDGYYMLTVAWNFGQGKGFEYNLGMKTSGVQPFSTIIYGTIAFFSNQVGLAKKDFPRVIILFSSILLFLFSLILKNTILTLFNEFDKDTVFFLCIIFSLLNFDLFITFTNGLETGLYILMFLISLRTYWKLLSDKSITNILAASLIFGLTALTRIDFLIISSVLLILALIFSKIKIKEVFIVVIIQFLFLLPWLIYIYNLTGTIIQSSALAQVSYLSSANLGNRIYQVILAFSQVITLNLYIRQQEFVLIIIGSVVTSLLTFSLLRSKNSFAGNQFKYISAFTALFFLIIIYSLTSYATYFYFRYFSPLITLMLLLFIPIFYKMMRDLSVTKNYLVGLLFVAVFAAHAYLYFHSGKVGGPTSLRPTYIHNNFKSSDLIGTFQSGVLGFYFENAVNLDGKINHFALSYSSHNKLNRYIDSVGINGLIEWREAFPIGNKFEFYKNWEKISDDIGDNRAICFKRRNKIL